MSDLLIGALAGIGLSVLVAPTVAGLLGRRGDRHLPPATRYQIRRAERARSLRVPRSLTSFDSEEM